MSVVVEIDGGIHEDTIEQAAEAGWTASSRLAVYSADDPAAAVQVSRHLRRRRHGTHGRPPRWSRWGASELAVGGTAVVTLEAVATTWARPRPAWMPVGRVLDGRYAVADPNPIAAGERFTLLRPAWPICVDHQIASGRTARHPCIATY